MNSVIIITGLPANIKKMEIKHRPVQHTPQEEEKKKNDTPPPSHRDINHYNGIINPPAGA